MAMYLVVLALVSLTVGLEPTGGPDPTVGPKPTGGPEPKGGLKPTVGPEPTGGPIWGGFMREHNILQGAEHIEKIDPPPRVYLTDSCQTIGLYEKLCHDGDSILSVSTETDNGRAFTTVKCMQGDLKCTNLSLNTGRENADEIRIEKCSLSLESLACIAGRVGSPQPERLKLKDVGPLGGSQLDGLGHVHTLIVNDYVNDGKWPMTSENLTSIVDNLPELTWLLIKSYNVTLTSGMFSKIYPNLTKLELSTDRIERLPARSFAGLTNLTNLLLYDNNISQITVESFEGLSKIINLTLGVNKIAQLPEDIFKSMPQLTRLQLHRNYIEFVHSNAFRGLKKLKQLALHNNQASMELSPFCFANLPSLSEINLQYANVSSLTADIFENTTNLTTLNLQGNRISELPEKIFQNMRILATLSLGGNNLTVLPGDVFQNLLNLKKLDLSNNKIEVLYTQHFRDLNNLEYLSLANNKLNTNEQNYLVTSLVFNQLINLKILDLSRNGFNSILQPIRFTMTQLTNLNLRWNKFTQILEDELQFLTNNELTVDLRDNAIESIFMDPMLNSLSKVTLKLSNNPLRCDCRIYSFLDEVISRRNILLDGATCTSPPTLQSLSLLSIPPTDLVCHDLPCADTCHCSSYPGRNQSEVTCDSYPKNYVDQSYPTNLILRNIPKNLTDISKSITNITLSNLNMTEIPNVVGNISFVDLTYNNLTKAPKDLLKRGVKLSLYGNPIKCDCGNIDSLKYLQENHNNILDYNILSCDNNTKVLRLRMDQICKDEQRHETFILVSILCTTFIIIMVLSILIHRYYLEIKVYLWSVGCLPKCCVNRSYIDGKVYDAFISFSHEDSAMVSEQLIPYLEKPPYCLKLCIHYRDWIPGDFIPLQIARSVEQSRRTVIILSKDFINSFWSNLEFRTAHINAVKEGTAKILVVLMDESLIKDKSIDGDLKAYLSMNTYLKWGDPQFWSKLRYALRPGKSEKAIVTDAVAIINDNIVSLGKEKLFTGLDARLNSDGKIVNGPLSLTAPSV